MNILNHVYYHYFKTGTILKIEVIRNGIDAPRFNISDKISNLNEFEIDEYNEIISGITADLYDEFTAEEIHQLSIKAIQKLKNLSDDLNLE